MFKCYILPNKIIVRTLKNAMSPAVTNKPKKTKWSNDYINFPFLFSFDRPHHYVDLNSRLITVEGNIGVGKEKFARKVAEYFALQFVDDVKEDDLYVLPIAKNIQMDMRKFNEVLPPSARIQTCEMFWNDEDPIKYGKPLLLQLHHYYWRFWYVCRSMAHLLNTGQGIVTNRSPWSDNIMALALKQCGLLSSPAYKYYDLVRCESLPNLWRPNIIIYLKASPEVIRQKLNQKNGWEKNARNISDKFIDTYTDILENKYLVDSALFSKIFTVDLSEHDVDNEDDFSALMESMSKLNPELKDINEFDTMYLDWRNGTHSRDQLDFNRTYFSSAKNCFTKSFRLRRIPYSLKEGAFSEDDLTKIHMVISRDGRYIEDPVYSSKYRSWKDILFHMPKFNYGNMEHTPIDLITKCWR